jgi:hypothetical protein
MKESYCSASKISLPSLGLLAWLLVCHISAAAVTFTNTPSTVSNTYSGTITLQIDGLTNGETVTVQKYLDINTNGAIDSKDWLVQQYNLTDGQAGMVIGGVTNMNVPGDSTGTNGAITSVQSFGAAGIVQQMVGKYLYRLSSTTGRFAAITNAFTVTNAAFAQWITGSVKSSSTNVANAGVLLFVPSSSGGLGSPIAGAIANNSGSYTIKAPSGTYLLWGFKNGYVTDFSSTPTLTLNSGATITTNLNLLSGTRTISGKEVDAANNSIVLPGLMADWETTNGLFAVGFTDSGGNFSSSVTSSLWQLACGDRSGLYLHGYLGLSDQARPIVLTTTGSVANVTAAFAKGTAMFYGTVTDDQGHPLNGVSF